MARIRTIKPEFFSSADVTSLPPLTRLLFIALWCEADRDGRMEWKPATFKLRYFPADDCDMESMCGALVESGMVVLYGEGLAYIPGFTKHQVINGREAESILPDPKTDHFGQKTSRVSDASRTRTDAAVGRKEGKEGKGKEDASRATRIPHDWKPSDDERRWAEDARPDLSIKLEIEKFRDYWTAKSGADATKRDWSATWRNWIRNSRATAANPPNPGAPRPPPKREFPG